MRAIHEPDLRRRGCSLVDTTADSELRPVAKALEGQAPNLALSYSSQGPIYGGIAAGWSLSIPEIALDTSNGILELAQGSSVSKTYVSSMAGSRPLVETSEPRAAGVAKTGWAPILEALSEREL